MTAVFIAIRPFRHALDFLRGRMRAYNDALWPVLPPPYDVLWSTLWQEEPAVSDPIDLTKKSARIGRRFGHETGGHAARFMSRVPIRASGGS